MKGPLDVFKVEHVRDPISDQKRAVSPRGPAPLVNCRLKAKDTTFILASLLR